ncbi:MAG: hypothetical protein AB7V62_15950 [Thermoleophilia bacterium]
MRKGLSAAVLAAVVLLAGAGAAAGKGIQFRITTDPPQAVTGTPVRIAVAGRFEEGFVGPCLRTRVVVVAPGVSVRRALHSLEGGKTSQRIGEWDAFRLRTLRSTARLRWSGTLRPNRPGTWRLVIPNFCALGYVLPRGAFTHRLVVR